MATRHNAPPPPPELVDEEEHGYRFVAETGIFRVAMKEDRMVALACAIVRGDEWFLSGFWTDADARQQGIGGPLLREVWDEGVRRGARRQFVWASIDATAIATYMKLGMLPGSQLFAFSGVPSLGAAAAVQTPELSIAAATSIDRVVRGVARAIDHEWWQAIPDTVARAVFDGGTLTGYYYVHHGQIGPAAWLADDAAPTVIGAALGDAARMGGETKIVVPGMNHAALRVVLAARLRLVRTSHLLWTAPFGQMERYIPSGPLLF
ncbi:MAG TPA: GNAT family N-acetyltransferase [Candidatus Limnocylindrales bacterium]|nr:GNAT family N-acetyltransferase [Candidatus Limnocylindrales bacterium]